MGCWFQHRKVTYAQNATWAKSFRPMVRQQMQRLARNVAGSSKLALERKFEHYVDA